jgi:hypothetical protein
LISASKSPIQNKIRRINSTEFMMMYRARETRESVENENELLNLFNNMNEAMGFDKKNFKLDDLKKFQDKLRFVAN